MHTVPAKSRERLRTNKIVATATSAKKSPKPAPLKSAIVLDNTRHDLFEIRKTGDVVLEVCFENTPACNKSIPAEYIKELRSAKSEIISPTAYYRVDLHPLRRNSKFFERLLGSEIFKEGLEIKDAFSRLELEGLKPANVEAEKLPRIAMVNDDLATKTLGREVVFLDLLRILHGEEHITRPLSLLYLTVLVIMADIYDCLPCVSRYLTSILIKFKYPTKDDRVINSQTEMKIAEEKLRQKIMIFYYTNQQQKFNEATKELILGGSVYWNSEIEPRGNLTAWWDLPDGLEAELSYRRIRLLLTISNLQMHFVQLYLARGIRLCKLGYTSSESCDQFQLGEIIKFLTRKGLLNLVPFQAVSSDDPTYVWPEAYSGDIETLIAELRAWPEYQIDGNHRHCGARVKMLPALKYVYDCIQKGAGMKITSWKNDRSEHSWMVPRSIPSNKSTPFVVGNEIVGEGYTVFDFTKASSGADTRNWERSNSDRVAKLLFTARRWIWSPEKEEESKILRPNGLAFKF
ncbi:hypothetical protein BJ878DRAFT_125725 [Calycina marina]|uniref:Uncharacterized protein n=1 Tax=Calycina marina TaxID=1763456 RepID=A0A9P7Z0U0_9HELO|nr:hypothetical protein BJ878DRAFT_125725 [Calycina marina]